MAWKRSGASISRSMMKRHTRLDSAPTSSCGRDATQREISCIALGVQVRCAAFLLR